MRQPALIVFLLGVDNTWLDHDRITADLKRHLPPAFGAERQERSWTIFETLRVELGYADDLEAPSTDYQMREMIDDAQSGRPADFHDQHRLF
jgi:hypothetical protein